MALGKRQTKYIFVTGGVLSGLGKGITAASIGNILKSRNLKVNIQKLDPYLNAIVDNNESNPLPYFNFAFSTGDKIDDLFVSGTVKDAMTLIKENQTAKDNKMVVGLYKAGENLDYKQKPAIS